MNTNNPTRPRVAIIGAGPSAVYALKRLITSEAPLAILIFESGARPGVGTPYDRQQNSPAMLSNIASIELPPVCETLLDWLQRIPPETRHGWGIGDADLHERHFFPRVVLGDYYADQFGALVNEGAARGHRITLHTRTRVSDIVAHEGGVWVTSDAVTKQAALAFDHAILATGHSVPKAHEADPSAFGRSVEPPFPAHGFAIFARTRIAVVPFDLALQFGKGCQLSAAHVLLLFRVLTEAFGDPPKEQEEGGKDECGKPERADSCRPKERNCLAHRRVARPAPSATTHASHGRD